MIRKAVVTHHMFKWGMVRCNLAHTRILQKACPILACLILLPVCLSCMHLHDEEKSGNISTPEDNRIIASSDGLDLKADEFYIRLNMIINNLGFTGPDEFTKYYNPRKAAELCLEWQWIKREDESLGIDDDPVFQMFLNRLSRDMHYAILARKIINETLPDPYTDNTTPPDEAEMREDFDQFARFIEINEGYKIHYIYLVKKEDDAEHNESQHRKAGQALARIRSGEDFIDVKMETTETGEPSRDPYHVSLASNKTEKMRSYVESMKPGDVTDVIDGGTGYFIIYVLPDQQITDVSSLEAVQNDPVAHKKLVDHILRQRPRIIPFREYFEALKKTQPGFEVFDTSTLETGQSPTPDTVLVRLNERQWTYGEINAINDSLDMDMTGKQGLDWMINELSYQILLSEKAYSGEVELDEGHEFTWQENITREYKRWLTRYHQNSILKDSDVQADDLEMKKTVSSDAEVLVDQKLKEMTKGLIMHLSDADLDSNRIRWAQPKGP
jgi:hypothetical protein